MQGLLPLAEHLVSAPRPLQRSSMRGSAESCGLTAAASSWTWQTCEGFATGASAQRLATPASLTTLRSSPCGGSQTSSGAQVHARRGVPNLPSSQIDRLLSE